MLLLSTHAQCNRTDNNQMANKYLIRFYKIKLEGYIG